MEDPKKTDFNEEILMSEPQFYCPAPSHML